MVGVITNEFHKFGELLIVGTQFRNMKKTHRRRNRNAHKIPSYITLTKRARLAEQTDIPSPRTHIPKMRTHLPVVQRKEGLSGHHLGRPTHWIARPPTGPNRPIFCLQTPTALPTLALNRSTSEVHSRIHPWKAI